MYYLLIFAMNISNLEPVVLKDCIPYKSVEASKIDSIAKDFQKSSTCEKSDGAKSWTCMNDKAAVVTKILLLDDKKECSNFPKVTANKMKTVLGR